MASHGIYSTSHRLQFQSIIPGFSSVFDFGLQSGSSPATPDIFKSLLRGEGEGFVEPGVGAEDGGALFVGEALGFALGETKGKP